MIKRKRRHVVFLCIVAVFLLMVFCYWQNTHIVTTRMDYINEKIPDKFHGFVIAHISDLHNTEFGKDQHVLLSELRAANPNCIVI
ncbi:MAG: phosphoesterase, partial [Caproiciproducens sp.]|nr:phosphoesterase [Caproiciproducens sp.]